MLPPHRRKFAGNPGTRATKYLRRHGMENERTEARDTGGRDPGTMKRSVPEADQWMTAATWEKGNPTRRLTK